MDDVVTKITSRVKDINTRAPSIKLPDIRPPAVSPKPVSNGYDMMFFVKVLLILIVLALLGLNVFTYLAKGTDMFSNLLAKYGAYIPKGIKQTLGLAKKGTELGLDAAADTLKDTKNVVEKTTGGHQKMWKGRDRSLEKAVNERRIRGASKYPEYEPDETEGQIQDKPKKGWCYIGTDRTFRSCIKVKDSDECLSGKIFPTQAICINPSLRE